MHFVITGGAGFIGSHLTDELLDQGHRVTVVDNLVTGQRSNLPTHPQLTLIEKDILTCTPKDFPDSIDGIAHLAATPSVTESWLDPIAAHHNNLTATLAVLNLCMALSIPRMAFASSAATYGDKGELPTSETQLTAPISPYGLQKRVSEQYAYLFAQQLGIAFVALRFFNVFGPRQLPHSAYSGVISIFVDRMQKGLPITIYGDGSQTRDFVFVKDVAVAVRQALTVPFAPGTCVTCNIGRGQRTSLLDLVEILKSSYPDWQAEINFAAAREGDIQHSQSDITQATKYLGFQPQWTVQAGLKLLVESLELPL
jgi:UDP-glucose 4-epimerase